MMIQRWMVDHRGFFSVTHDRSKPLRRNEAFLRILMSPASSRMVGYGKRKAELPLRIEELAFGDSLKISSLQVADLVAGAAVDCFLAISGVKPKQAYHNVLLETQLPRLFIGGVLPSVDDVTSSSQPAPEEKSIPDGTADFLREVGFFDRKRASR
jgi:hypothetical protein